MLQSSKAGLLGLIVVAGCGDQAQEALSPPEVVVGMEPARTAECQFGGTVIRSGLDDNRNGTLDDDEVQARTVVCSEPPAAPPPPIVVRLAREPEGGRCAMGGTAVQSGPDRNRNERLDDDEVEHVDYVCGEALLSRIGAEPIGMRCVAGGVAFLFGRDRDHDGELDDDEVEQIEVECGSVLSRSVVIRTPADAAALAGITIIDGSLSVTGTDLTELELPRLVQVREALEIANDDSLVRVAMPALQAVDAELTLAGNPRLTALEMPALQRVGGLTVDSNAALPDLNGVAELDSVVHDLTITGNGALGSADLAVTRVGGALTIVGNSQLTRSVWSLRERLSRVRVASNDRLDTVEVTVLEFGADLPEVSISSNPVLQRIALSAFAPRTIAIEDNPALIEVVVTTDLSIRGDVMVRNNGPLQLTIAGSGVFGLPTEIAGSLTLSGPVEEFRSTQPLVIGGDCTIDGTRLIALDRATSLFRVGGTLRLIDNARLTTVFTLGLGGGLEVRGNAALATLGFLAQDEIEGDLIVADNPALQRAPSLARLTRIRGDGRVASNPVLEAAFSTSLLRVDRNLSLDHNDNLGAIDLGRLAHARTVAITGCPLVTVLDLLALSQLGAMEVRGNAALRHLRLPRLRSADLGVFDNPRLPACEVEALFVRVIGDHHQSGNDGTAVCE